MRHIASYQLEIDDGKVKCTLCPHACKLALGKTGICRVRRNDTGILVTDVYGFVSAIHMDPIEKKPLYHFNPGKAILSIGSYGCNLRCTFCQNCTISQTGVEPGLKKDFFTPEELVQIALQQKDNIGLAFTYNEPTVWFEYMLDIAKLAKASGLKTVMVTNGYINEQPLNELITFMDAFSVDLKAFTDDFYKKVTSSDLAAVKETLIRIRKAGKHLEIVNLLIPGLNDDDLQISEMAKWIAKELGKNTPLHLSRYYPQYKMTNQATPESVLRRVHRIALEKLTYVYIGNIAGELNNTLCSMCKNLLITRNSYQVQLPGLDIDSRCNRCGEVFS